jgi:hypothetical protein
MTVPSVRRPALSGQPTTYKLRLKAADGTYQDLAGRSFSLALMSSRATLYAYTATVATEDGASTATMTVPAAANTALLTGKGVAEDYRLSIGETVDGAYAEIMTGVHQVRLGPDLDSAEDGGAEGEAVVYSLLADTGLIEITQQGAPGSSAAQLLYQAGLIDAPTAEAMDAYYRAAGDQAAEDATAAADLATQKAALADAAAVLANSKAALADSKATAAQGAAGLATDKAALASTAADLANTKAALADTKATLADQKAALADTAAGTANTAAGLATTKAGVAQAAADDYAGSKTALVASIAASEGAAQGAASEAGAARDIVVTAQADVLTRQSDVVTRQADVVTRQAAAALSAAQAIAASPVYATTTAGLAAVAEGAYFTVVGDGSSTFAILYWKTSGAAVEQARWAAKPVVDAALAALAAFQVARPRSTTRRRSCRRPSPRRTKARGSGSRARRTPSSPPSTRSRAPPGSSSTRPRLTT